MDSASPSARASHCGDRGRSASSRVAARRLDDVNQEPFSPIFDAAESSEDLDNVEARFHLSFKGRVWAADDHRWGLWLAYTQQSQWQVYSGDISSPFRETNYMPELFGSFRPGVDLGGLIVVAVPR